LLTGSQRLFISESTQASVRMFIYLNMQNLETACNRRRDSPSAPISDLASVPVGNYEINAIAIYDEAVARWNLHFNCDTTNAFEIRSWITWARAQIGYMKFAEQIADAAASLLIKLAAQRRCSDFLHV